MPCWRWGYACSAGTRGQPCVQGSPASIAASFAGETDETQQWRRGRRHRERQRWRASSQVQRLVQCRVGALDHLNLCRALAARCRLPNAQFRCLGSLRHAPPRARARRAVGALLHREWRQQRRGADEDRRRIQLVLPDNGMPFDFAAWMKLVSCFAWRFVLQFGEQQQPAGCVRVQRRCATAGLHCGE